MTYPEATLTPCPGTNANFLRNPRDRGDRKVQRRTERELVELAASRGEGSETGYTRRDPEGAPLFSPP